MQSANEQKSKSKRHRAAALHDAGAKFWRATRSARSWSAAALCRFHCFHAGGLSVHWPDAALFWSLRSPYVVSYKLQEATRGTCCHVFHVAGIVQLSYREATKSSVQI